MEIKTIPTILLSNFYEGNLINIIPTITQCYKINNDIIQLCKYHTNMFECGLCNKVINTITPISITIKD